VKSAQLNHLGLLVQFAERCREVRLRQGSYPLTTRGPIPRRRIPKEAYWRIIFSE
jgi:hypothetical protein